jgi:hypothetical protein
MLMCFKIESYSVLGDHSVGESAYSFDYTFFRLICLTAKALHRMAMHGFLVGATEPEKRTLKRVQLRILG